MQISARSYLTAGISLTAATAIAFTPLAVPVDHPTATIPEVTTSDFQLTASDFQLTVTPADIKAFTNNLQAVLDHGTDAATTVAGVPGRGLIGVVDNIVRLIDVGFTAAIDGATDPTRAASLEILKTFSYDAFAMLDHNLGLINPVITTTTGTVGDLITTAITGSLQNILTAIVNVANDPLAFANYAGLLTAGVASGQLIVNNGLRAIQALGDGGFDIVGTAITEVTFQLNNAVARLGELATHLSDASGSAVAQAVIATVRHVVIAPALAVVNLGVAVTHGVLDAANAGFDLVLNGAANVVDAGDLKVPSVDTAEDPKAESTPSADIVPVTADDPAGQEQSTPAGDTVTDEAETESAPGDKTPDAPADEAPATATTAKARTRPRRSAAGERNTPRRQPVTSSDGAGHAPGSNP